MTYRDLFEHAFHSLVDNKFRSSLAMFGIIVGIAGVVSVTILMGSLKANIEGEFKSLGSQYLKVYPFNSSGGKATSPLTIKDVRFIKQHNNRYIQRISGTYTTSARLLSKQHDERVILKGVNFHYPEITAKIIQQGRFFHRVEQFRFAKVAVIGKELLNMSPQCFQSKTPCKLNLNGHEFTVVGVFNDNGSNALDKDFDETVFIPYTTMTNYFKASEDVEIELLATPHTDVMTVKKLIQQQLNKRHGITSEEDGFLILVQQQLLKSTQDVMGKVMIISVLVSSIALLVGGIGIMNIMLVSVAERRHEIAIRKANGASPADIRNQFLMESIYLCAIGGLFGSLIGIGFSLIMGQFFKEIGQLSIGLNVHVSIALLCTILGVIFGTFPAHKAATLDPCDCLRR